MFSDTGQFNNQVPRGNQAIKVGLNHQKGVVVQCIMLGELIFMEKKLISLVTAVMQQKMKEMKMKKTIA